MNAFDADVAIIGFGPTGVSAANALGALGVSAIAFERDADIYPRARAVTINDWTMRCFQSVGLDDAVGEDLDLTMALRWILYDGTEIMRMEFPPSTLGHARSYAIYQPLLEQTLRDGVSRYADRVRVEFGKEVTDLSQDDDAVTVKVRDLATGDDSSVRVRYVLACDGGSSHTRSLIGSNMLGDTVDTTWVVIDAKVKRWWPDRHILTFWSDQQRPVVDIALAKGNHRWELPLGPDESEADFQTQEQIWNLLENLGVSRDDVDVHQHAFYRHHIRMADAWRKDRVFLLGDAAHLMPPWAGQGMQSGVRDAFNLAWKISGVIKGQLPDSILDSYQSERQPNVQMYTEIAVGLGMIIKQELTPEQIAASAPPPGEEPPLIQPPFLVGGWLRGDTGPSSVIGKMIPQPLAASPQGVISKLDDLMGNGFILLGDDIDPREVLSADEKAEWDRLGVRYCGLRSVTGATQGPDDIVDVEGKLSDWMKSYGARVIAVRPDRFVAACNQFGLSVPTES